MAGFRQNIILALSTAIFAAGVGGLPVPQARAFDFFGLFGSEKPPPVTPKTLPYVLKIGSKGDAKDLKQALQDTSLLYRLRQDAPQDGDELARRAEADLPRLIDTMWGHGHYAAKVRIDIAGVMLVYGQERTQAATAAAARYRGRQHVPVQIVLEPGPLYRFAQITIVDAASGLPFPAGILPPDILEGVEGGPARTEALVTLAAKINGRFQSQGHPYVKITDPAPVIDHRNRTVAIKLAVTPGPRAPIGQISVSGNKNVPEKVIRSFIYVEPGVMFSPKRLADIRKSVSRIEALGGARVRPAEKLDPDGSVPLEVNVSERLPRALGAAASYSTIDGPTLKTYWMHRNLFGGAERLRLSADLFYLTNGARSITGRKADFKDNIGGRLAASFIKPALGGSRIDFLADAFVLRERTDAYQSTLGNVQAALRYRFADKAWIQAGLEYERGHTQDFLGTMNYTLVGLPITAQLDTTEDLLDPKNGVRIKANVTPYKGFGDVAPTLVASSLVMSAYYSLDEKSRYILAGRIAFASVAGGKIRTIPANRRLFAGGGGSVRGYAYRSLGPKTATGQLIGGRSLFEASLEARVRITDTIGIVPFIDVGQAYASTLPNFNDIRIGAGIGLRYYTAIGPIRLDVAFPINRQRGEDRFGVYLSLGQAF
ncbi:MAG: BamA/TamA family outer membrane protein [Hyphomicrobiales bacterium]|nr:BamA/TamA family outer membrane protein [Hyphomicrobiales bacterium]